MEKEEGSEKQIKMIGYGTFIIRSASGESIFKVIGTGSIKNFVRIYHPKFEEMGVFYPFAVPTEKNSKLKALVYDISVEDLKELDFYEGVPHLFQRTSCKVLLSDGKEIDTLIYIPSRSTCEELKDRLKLILNDEELKEMWEKDLWLKKLKEDYPLVERIYPKLFE
ncbi:MAG: gamma-glutamylcyclotransferase family protein [Candidatus Hodarchaeota archaeon]